MQYSNTFEGHSTLHHSLKQKKNFLIKFIKIFILIEFYMQIDLSIQAFSRFQSITYETIPKKKKRLFHILIGNQTSNKSIFSELFTFNFITNDNATVCSRFVWRNESGRKNSFTISNRIYKRRILFNFFCTNAFVGFYTFYSFFFYLFIFLLYFIKGKLWIFFFIQLYLRLKSHIKINKFWTDSD